MHGAPDPQASPASLSSGKTTFDNERACTPAPQAVTSAKYDDAQNEESQNLDPEVAEEDSGGVAPTSAAGNVRFNAQSFRALASYTGMDALG